MQTPVYGRQDESTGLKKCPAAQTAAAVHALRANSFGRANGDRDPTLHSQQGLDNSEYQSAVPCTCPSDTLLNSGLLLYPEVVAMSRGGGTTVTDTRPACAGAEVCTSIGTSLQQQIGASGCRELGKGSLPQRKMGKRSLLC
mmetsp:Transcript_49057/g.87484  ORF Transcript_49057/g.87484 Transcript_49057/m.87484 type:complete len:142 (+) Transcript_49057:469-894(+)